MQPATAQLTGRVDGNWHGTLTVVSATPATPGAFWHTGDTPEIRIDIAGDVAVVRVKKGEWRELRVAGGFHVSRLESSAFVYSVQAAGGWVENWTFTVTTKNADTLLVFMSYVAGGTLDRIEQVESEFAVGAMGELARSAALAAGE
jgi:hypothetical protein